MKASSESGLWATVISRMSAAELMVFSVSETAVILLWTPASRLCRPYGTCDLLVCTRHFHAGLSHAAASRLEVNRIKVHRFPTIVSHGRGKSFVTVSFAPSGLVDRTQPGSHGLRRGLHS